MATGDSPGTAEGFMATAEAGGAADAREAIVRLIGLPALRADERLRDLVATAVRITGCQIAVLSLFDATQECEIAAVGTTAEVRPLATSLAHALLTGTVRSSGCTRPSPTTCATATTRPWRPSSGISGS